MLRGVGLYCLLAAFTVGNALSYDVPCNTNLNPQGILGQPVGNSNLSGCLTAGTGLTPDPDPTAGGDFTIAWQITSVSGGYQYQYTFTDPTAPQKALSHVIIGLSANCMDQTCIWDPTPASAGIQEWGDEGNSNPDIPDLLWGIKFNTSNDPTIFSVAFLSNRIPVWQNVYAKSGQYEGGETYIYNTGFDPTTIKNGLKSYYIAAPDSVVPEPAFYGMLAAGLGGLYLALRRRR